MANWDDNDWWNKPIGEGQQPQRQQTQGEERPQPSPVEVVQRIAQETYAQQTQQYASWAEKRQQELAQATAAWQADKDLAPYFDLARQKFVDLDGMFQQQKPVAEVVDMVKRDIMTLRAQGFQPPKAAQRPPGFAPANTPYDIPLDPSQPRRQYEDQNEKLAANHAYLRDRQIDLDRRKFRGDESDLKRLEDIREAQYTNRVTIEK